MCDIIYFQLCPDTILLRIPTALLVIHCKPIKLLSCITKSTYINYTPKVVKTDIRSPCDVIHFQEESRETGQKSITEITSDKSTVLLSRFCL